MGIQITSKHSKNIGSSEERLTVGPWITTEQALNHSSADSIKQSSQYNNKDPKTVWFKQFPRRKI